MDKHCLSAFILICAAAGAFPSKEIFPVMSPAYIVAALTAITAIAINPLLNIFILAPCYLKYEIEIFDNSSLNSLRP
jgi:hypothetical protein